MSYYIKLKDPCAGPVTVEVSYDVYEAYVLDRRREKDRELYELQKHGDYYGFFNDESIADLLNPLRESPEDIYIEKETFQLMCQCIKRHCSNLQYKRLLYKYVYGYRVVDIALIERRSPGGITTAIQRAVENLQKNKQNIAHILELEDKQWERD